MRFIDADALLNKLPNDLPYKGSVKRVLIQAPTADVVPKSEVERLEKILDSYAFQYGTVTDKQVIIDHEKAKVAREIVESIRKEIKLALKSNYSVREEVESSDELYHSVSGKISALRGIDDFLDEIEEKCMEGI